jgi:chloramphenicol 3-O phosphotransferase
MCFVKKSSTVSLFHHTIMAFSKIGKNSIVDHVFVIQAWLEECRELLNDTTTFFVGVHCPLEGLERRERERGNRRIGLAKSQFDVVHKHKKYDFEVDTFVHSSKECALQIMQFFERRSYSEYFGSPMLS